MGNQRDAQRRTATRRLNEARASAAGTEVVRGLSKAASETWHRRNQDRDQPPESTTWAAVFVRSGREALADMILMRRLGDGFHTWWPSEMVKGKAGTGHWVRRSILPGLVFIGVEDAEGREAAKAAILGELHRVQPGMTSDEVAEIASSYDGPEWKAANLHDPMDLAEACRALAPEAMLLLRGADVLAFRRWLSMFEAWPSVRRAEAAPVFSEGEGVEVVRGWLRAKRGKVIGQDHRGVGVRLEALTGVLETARVVYLDADDLRVT